MYLLSFLIFIYLSSYIYNYLKYFNNKDVLYVSDTDISDTDSSGNEYEKID